jgi:hypothetical protein
MNEFICYTCDKKFKSQEALSAHTSDVHNNDQSHSKKSLPIKKIRNWGIFIIVLISLFGIILWSGTSALNSQKSCLTQPAETINIGGHSNLAMHIHPKLTIILDGQDIQIPSNIGLGQNLMRPLHTHDSSGTLHVEGPCLRDFTLGDFFIIWGQPFSSSQIMDKKSNEGTIKMTVDGISNLQFEKLILQDNQEIIIEYSSIT